jgi:hypothetical protein
MSFVHAGCPRNQCKAGIALGMKKMKSQLCYDLGAASQAGFTRAVFIDIEELVS